MISTAVALPVSLLVGVAASSGDPAAAGWSVAVMIAVLTPLSMVLNSATALGVVPIWRDLTDHPEYRSIDEGEPRP